MATLSYYDVIATSYSCSNHALPVSGSVTALCPATCGSVAAFTGSSLTTSVCISQAASTYNVMTALPQTLVSASRCSDQLPAVGAVLQCSSLPVSSHNLMTVSSGKSASRVCLAKINSSLLCFLCGGYLIDATTSNRCLHSFCRACILRHLKLVNFCPVCKALLGGTHPQKSLRPDRTLQRVVYKVVPGLYKNERERRRKFAAVCRKPDVIRRSHQQKVRLRQSNNLAAGRLWIYSDDENFSVCLRHQLHLNNASAYWAPFPVTDGDGSNSNRNQLIGCRFVLCPALTSMHLIKKFIKLKLNLREKSKVFLFCSGEILPDDYTLLDIAYIFSWMKTGPLLIDYVILNTVVLSGDDACRLSSVDTLTEDAQLPPQQNSGSASNETNMREAETECLAFGFDSNQSGFGVHLDPAHQDAHFGFSNQGKYLNYDRSKQDVTGSNISFSGLLNNVPLSGFLPSFSEVAQLQSSSDASHRVDLNTENTETTERNSPVSCSEDPQTLGYSCENVKMRGSDECLRPELSTSQFAQTAYQQMSHGTDCDHCLASDLSILPETASVPHLNSSSCRVGGMYSCGEAASSCGIQLIGVLAHSVDGPIGQLPNSCFLYNRPSFISGWHPSFHETEADYWRNVSDTNNCFTDREIASEGVQFLLPMMPPPLAKAVADDVADVTGVGLSVYQCSSASAECGEPSLPYNGCNIQSLPMRAMFNVDARTEVTQRQMLDDLDASCQRSALQTSPTSSVPRDIKGDVGGEVAAYSREKSNDLNREADEEIADPEQQCIILSEGPSQLLPSLHTDGRKESTQMFNVYDSSAGYVSEDNMIIDRSVAVSTCHVADHDSSCSLSLPTEYMTTVASSQRVPASEYHLPQFGAHLTQATSCALLSTAQRSESLEASSHLTMSHFPTAFRCSPSPASFNCCQVAAAASSDQSNESMPAILPNVEQNSLEYDTETHAKCRSQEAGSDSDQQQTPPTAIETDRDEKKCQFSEDDRWDERWRDESLTVTSSVSSELTKTMLADAVDSESRRVEMESPPVDMVLAVPHHLSFDSANLITDRSLELTTQS